MSVHVVGPEPEADRPAAAVEEEPDREAEVVRVDAAAVGVGDRRLLVVGALDQADRRVERSKPLDVGRGAVEVRLEADPGPRLDRAQPLVQGDGRLDVRAALHVDPEVGARGGGMLGEPDEVGEADVRVVVEPELGGLDRDLAVDPGGHDLVDRLEVVGGDLLGLGEVLEVLAEPRVERADPGGLERQRGRQGILECLARHEPADRPAHEPKPWQTLFQPAVAGGPQEHAAHRVLHRQARAGPSDDRRPRARIAPMTRYYDIDAANAAVPELDGIVRVLAEQRAELVRLRDEVLARGGGGGDGAPTATLAAERAGGPDEGARSPTTSG